MPKSDLARLESDRSALPLLHAPTSEVKPPRCWPGSIFTSCRLYLSRPGIDSTSTFTPHDPACQWFQKYRFCCTLEVNRIWELILSNRAFPSRPSRHFHKILATDGRSPHIHWNNVHGKNLASLIVLATEVALSPAMAQNWDASGNGQLHGTYYFREVVWTVASNDGTLGEAIAAYGNIVFDGNGNYALSNAQVCDSASCLAPSSVQSFQASGTYSISASGYGFIKGLSARNESIYGLTSPQGIFIGSSTDNSTGFNDLFIAAPLPSPAPTN